MSEMLTFHHTFRGAFKRGNEISVHLLITCEPQTFCKLGTFEIPVLEFLSNRYLGIIREKKQEATFSLVICWEESMRTSNQMHKNSLHLGDSWMCVHSDTAPSKVYSISSTLLRFLFDVSQKIASSPSLYHLWFISPVLGQDRDGSCTVQALVLLLPLSLVPGPPCKFPSAHILPPTAIIRSKILGATEVGLWTCKNHEAKEAFLLHK